MSFSRLFPILASIGIILLIAVLQERSKFLAALLATMPLTAPLALWVVYAANRDKPEQVTAFTASMIPGIIATAAFVVACWVALKLRLPFPLVILGGYAIWGLIAFLLGLVIK